MERQIMWSSWEGPGLEHLHLYQQEEGIVADSMVLGLEGQMPFRLHYKISCDAWWRVRTVHLSMPGGSVPSLHLFSEEVGVWRTEHGDELPLLQGCLDIDISATPFTNTLPIRRLALQPGTSAILNVVYIRVPQMQVEVLQQRYTYLEAAHSEGRYRYESLVDGVSRFTAEISVDQDGLVLDYPGLFRRVGTW